MSNNSLSHYENIFKNMIIDIFNNNPNSHRILFEDSQTSREESIYNYIYSQDSDGLSNLMKMYLNSRINTREVKEILEDFVKRVVDDTMHNAKKDSSIYARDIKLSNRTKQLKKLWEVGKHFLNEEYLKEVSSEMDNLFDCIQKDLYTIVNVVLAPISEEEFEYKMAVVFKYEGVIFEMENNFIEAFRQIIIEQTRSIQISFPEIKFDEQIINDLNNSDSDTIIPNIIKCLEYLISIEKTVGNSSQKTDKNLQIPVQNCSHEIESYINTDIVREFTHIYELDLRNALSYKNFNDFILYLKRCVIDALKNKIKNRLNIRNNKHDTIIKQIIENDITVTKNKFYIPEIEQLTDKVQSIIFSKNKSDVESEIDSLFTENDGELTHFQKNLLRIAKTMGININLTEFCSKVSSRFEQLSSDKIKNNRLIFGRMLVTLQIAITTFTQRKSIDEIFPYFKRSDMSQVDNYLTEISWINKELYDFEKQYEYVDEQEFTKIMNDYLKKLLNLQYAINCDEQLTSEDKNILLEEIDKIYQVSQYFGYKNNTLIAVNTAKKLLLQQRNA